MVHHCKSSQLVADMRDLLGTGPFWLCNVAGHGVFSCFQSILLPGSKAGQDQFKDLEPVDISNVCIPLVVNISWMKA